METNTEVYFLLEERFIDSKKGITDIWTPISPKLDSYEKALSFLNRFDLSKDWNYFRIKKVIIVTEKTEETVKEITGKHAPGPYYLSDKKPRNRINY